VNPAAGISEIEIKGRLVFTFVNAVVDSGSNVIDFAVFEAFCKAVTAGPAAAHRHRGSHVPIENVLMARCTSCAAGIRRCGVCGEGAQKKRDEVD
jgi:hypothetical protein